MCHAHGSLNALDIFPAVLCNCTVNGGSPVEVLNSRNTQCNPGEGGKAMLLDFLRGTSIKVN